MKYFDFDSLIEKYSSDYVLETEAAGTYDNMGLWVKGGITSVSKRGAIMGISERRIYRSDGVLTERDKELYSKEPLGDITKAYVLYHGNRYSITVNPQGNGEFTGVWQYTLKWVSVFEEV